MQGVEIDAEGMLPQALADALGSVAPSDGKAVYLSPTLHNPTTATMSLERRQAIVEICRKAGAWIIEDGVYAAAFPDLPELSALAPDISLHVNGLSKSLGPGLLIGWQSCSNRKLGCGVDAGLPEKTNKRCPAIHLPGRCRQGFSRSSSSCARNEADTEELPRLILIFVQLESRGAWLPTQQPALQLAAPGAPEGMRRRRDTPARHRQSALHLQSRCSRL